MSEVNLDGCLLAIRMVELARPESLDGWFEVGSFADFVPENLVRFLFEAGEASVQHPLLWT